MNVETLRQNHKDGFFGSVNLKVTGASGSTDRFVNDFATQNVFRSDKDEFLFFANHLYGEVSNTKNTDRGSVHGRYSRSITGITALEFYAQVEFDKFRALRLRRIYGTGLRWKLLDIKAASVYSGIGAFFENEDLDADPDEQTARGNMYTAYVQNFENKMQLSTTFYYQPSLSQSDFRLQLNANLGIPITQKFKFTIEFQAAHDSAPPTGIVKTDTLYLTGIAFSY
jgi:putative salt-induced outer membrane protein YdiY